MCSEVWRVEEGTLRMGAGLGKWRRWRERLGTMLFIYRYFQAKGVGRWAWHVVVDSPCDKGRECGGRVWAMEAVKRGCGCARS